MSFITCENEKLLAFFHRLSTVDNNDYYSFSDEYVNRVLPIWKGESLSQSTGKSLLYLHGKNRSLTLHNDLETNFGFGLRALD